MANEEQLSILKQGVDVWNDWRSRSPINKKIDLADANLREINLSHANLKLAILSGANLSGARLRGANLTQTDLIEVDLSDADLTGAALSGANLFHSNLQRTVIRTALLDKVVLCGSKLIGARLSECYLLGTDLSDAQMGNTEFVHLDLGTVIGLDKVRHQSPSSISIDTLVRSRGKIPQVFLRGCGLSDWEVEQAKLYDPELTNPQIGKIQERIYDMRSTRVLQISPLFISYSRADSEFVNKIGASLTDKGIRYWRDIHDMKAGRIEKQIEQEISDNRTVLLVLSEHSLKSDWVQHEVRMARETEKKAEQDVLCPIALDDSWKSSRWPKRVMEQIMEYNILDFSAWADDVKFDGMFRRLIDGLELFYKG
jgi:hypothetical protein